VLRPLRRLMVCYLSPSFSLCPCKSGTPILFLCNISRSDEYDQNENQHDVLSIVWNIGVWPVGREWALPCPGRLIGATCTYSSNAARARRFAGRCLWRSGPEMLHAHAGPSHRTAQLLTQGGASGHEPKREATEGGLRWWSTGHRTSLFGTYTRGAIRPHFHDE